MHEYSGSCEDRGDTAFCLGVELLEFVAVVLMYLAILGTAGFAAHQFLLLRDRVEAIEHTLSQPIEIELDFEELQFPNEPTPAPRKGGMC
jgi:hypothetical protein